METPLEVWLEVTIIRKCTVGCVLPRSDLSHWNKSRRQKAAIGEPSRQSGTRAAALGTAEHRRAWRWTDWPTAVHSTGQCQYAGNIEISHLRLRNNYYRWAVFLPLCNHVLLSLTVSSPIHRQLFVAMFAFHLSRFFFLCIATSTAQSGNQYWKGMPWSEILNLELAVTSSPRSSFINNTSSSPSTITSSPSLNTTSSLSANTSCSSCVIALDVHGLQKIFWFSQTWSVTLDTEHVTVTSFNGSNLTALTSTRTVLGNVSALDTSVPFVQSLINPFSEQGAGVYFNFNPTLVRAKDGSVGTTSFSYGQAFAEVTAIDYLYTIPDPQCPMGMGLYPYDSPAGCHCVLNSFFPFFDFLGLVANVNSSVYGLDQTFYTPLASSVMNEDQALNDVGIGIGAFSDWDGEHFMSWLAEDEAFKSAFPHWEDCAVWHTGTSSFAEDACSISVPSCWWSRISL